METRGVHVIILGCALTVACSQKGRIKEHINIDANLMAHERRKNVKACSEGQWIQPPSAGRSTRVGYLRMYVLYTYSNAVCVFSTISSHSIIGKDVLVMHHNFTPIIQDLTLVQPKLKTNGGVINYT